MTMSSNEQPRPPKLLDQVAAKTRLLHYSNRTEQAYVDWVKRFILFHNKRQLALAAALSVAEPPISSPLCTSCPSCLDAIL